MKHLERVFPPQPPQVLRSDPRVHTAELFDRFKGSSGHLHVEHVPHVLTAWHEDSCNEVTSAREACGRRRILYGALITLVPHK